MLRLFLGSWSSCLRMYSQSFLVSSVLGSGSFPTTAVSAASGCTGLLRAFLGAAAFLGVGIGQLERAGLGCQAKNQQCFHVVRGSAGARGISSRSAILVGVLGHLEVNNLLWGVICGFHILLTSI